MINFNFIKKTNLIEPVYIYTLNCPSTGEVKYVGKSKRPDRRLYEHIYESIKGKNTYKNNWISSILKTNKKPIMEILCVTEDRYSIDAELYYYSKFKNLTNTLTTKGFLSYKGKDFNKKIVDSLKNSKKRKKPTYYIKRGVRVIGTCKKTGKKYEFESIRDACKFMGRNLDSCVSKVCKKRPKYKSAGGFYWEYKKD
jgi:hypothetical protein